MEQRILITGSSGGFGFLTCQSLIEKGHKVVGTMRSTKGKNEKVADSLKSIGVHLVEMDVTDEESVNKGVKNAIDLLSGLDVLINNAGVGVFGMQEHFTPEDMKYVFDVNVFGVQRVMRAALPHFRKQGKGTVIYTSSLLGRMTLPFYGVYNASKWALEAIAENYRTELSVFGIESSIIERGGFPTTFMENLKRPSDNSRNESYGEFMQAPKAMFDGFEQALEANTEQRPQKVADAITNLIAVPYGEKLEEYFYDYNDNTPHQLRSATKPFIGGILGIAVDQGFIKSEKDKLLPYFNSIYSEIVNLDKRKKEITIDNFLMYRHGMDCENNNPESKGNESKMMQSKDWVKYTLDLPMVGEPVISSSYCTGCALILGNLVEIATDKKIEDFAKENLFDPLNISNYKWTFESNQTSSDNFSQAYFTPRDLIKLVKLFKDDGKWNGNQIISKSWIDKTFNMDKGDYGYLWEHKYFIVDGKIYNSYLASGNGGQKINIWPELDMITVFTGGNYNSYQLLGKSTPPNEMIPNYILKSVK